MDSKIENITVFLSNAQITRSALTSVSSGQTKVILEGLSPNIDNQSIQVSAKGKAVIMGIKHQYNYLQKTKFSQKVKILRDSVAYYSEAYNLNNDKIEVLQGEQTLLKKNLSIGGTQNGVSVDELKKMTDFYSTKLTGIKKELRRISKEQVEIQKSLEAVRQQLGELNAIRDKRTSEIEITFSATSSERIGLEVKYLVNNCGWYPTYDIRAVDTKSPIELDYKAFVFQNSGIDWKDVKLTLSTINPTYNGSLPELSTSYVNLYVPPTYNKRAKQQAVQAPVLQDYAEEELVLEAEADEWGGFDDDWGDAETAASYTSAVKSTLATNFVISIPYDIPSDGNEKLVEIANENIEANFVHHAIPQLDPDAYLIANITNWEQYNLLPGTMNIYFSGTFVGSSELATDNLTDTLSLSLGTDKNVVINRKSLGEYNEKKAIGANKKESKGFEITIRNTKTEDITLFVKDNVPVSKDSRVEVTLEESKGASYNANTGILEWKMDLKPSETKTLKFSYAIKYPKNDQIIIQQY
ncbi:DUF4139 domain-containing protein [Flexithrix dorotheae]|uniref:DUF4139 domain-containing protein n=1 Tax=Flexithrix dorotheae TaxID=70993 RepID=UPI001469E24A|nr:DUF4139 domain-containing protein [Flexithrix dorotheae]